MVRIKKRYHPGINYGNIKKELKVVRILSILCFLLAVFAFVLHLSKTMAVYFLILGVAMLWLDIIWFVQKLQGGYTLSDDNICYWRKFKKYKIYFNDVQSVFIVNASTNNGDVMNLPYVLIIGGRSSGVMQYCMHDRTQTGVLMNTEIEFVLIKDRETENNYGLLWNCSEMQKILRGYQGDYYVAESVINSFKDEYELICGQYNIKKQVKVIPDKE